MTAKTVMKCLSDLFCTFGFPSYIHSDRGLSFMNHDVKRFLTERGIASSCSSPYHPTGNSQCERANQTVWKTIKLMLHSRGWPEERWQDVVNDALHALRSMLCKATNETPHERMFRYSRNAMIGNSMPSWLLTEGPVLLRRHVRNKGDPLCEVVLLDANPTYAHVRYASGRQDTVSTSDLAPCPSEEQANTEMTSQTLELANETPPATVAPPEHQSDTVQQSPITPSTNVPSAPNADTPIVVQDSVRRSARPRKAPDRYGEWI